MVTNGCRATTRYVGKILDRDGVAGVATEARRLVRKMEAAASCYRDGAVKEMLATRGVAERLARMEAADDAAALAHEVATLSETIVTAQRKADPAGKASLILHTSEEWWERFPSYSAYRDSYAIG